ncbi:unnamed protein product [Orchesella dallaii]|uniref:ATP synthase F0 subunit 8 n=1 Tax=Orchesella dallaii TaxID=48710 RepID=A0ABP1RRG9_9HEXA
MSAPNMAPLFQLETWIPTPWANFIHTYYFYVLLGIFAIPLICNLYKLWTSREESESDVPKVPNAQQKKKDDGAGAGTGTGFIPTPNDAMKRTEQEIFFSVVGKNDKQPVEFFPSKKYRILIDMA